VLFHELFDSRRTARPRRRPSARALALEPLNDRVVPASLSVSDVSIFEGDFGTQSAMVTVRLSGPVNPPVYVNYSTANGTALAGSDYTATSGRLTFLKGQTIKTIVVPVVGDLASEPDETFFVNLRTPKHATIADSQGVVTIGDDDTRLSITDVTAAEGNEGTTAFNFNVNLSAPSASTVTVNYATAGGTALEGSDFAATSGMLTFAPGQTSMPVTVLVNGDRLGEGDETFFVNLSGAANAAIADSQGMGMITNDEPRLTVEPVSRVEGDGGTTDFVFAATLSDPTNATVTVDWATGDWTAVAGEDYAAAGGTLIFGPGQTTQLITVPVNGDQGIEYDESFLVNFSNANGVVLGSDHTWGTILNDDGSIISVSDGWAWEGSPGDVIYIAFTVSLSAPSTDTVTVDFTTVDGWATAGWDYMPVSGTLTFNPGEPTTQTIWVQVLGDYDYEGDESFSLSLSNNTGNTLIQPGGGNGTIWDDDYYYDPGYYYYDPYSGW
jgi:hypothetical protein